MGDFNVALNIADSHSGSPQMNLAMIEFKDCVYNIEVMDINSTGLHFTWNQKLKDGDGVLKKLDRIMGNIEFIDSFPGAHAIFQPYRISDHSLAVLKIPTLTSTKPKPFKLFNFIMFKSKFLEVVADFWNRNVEGHTMFQVVNKMKSLKKPLRKLVHNHGNLHDRVSKLRAELDEVQKALDLDQNNQILREEEAMYVEAFNIAKLDEERFLKQKAKIDNMECEDLNIDGLFQNKVSGTSYLDMVRQVSDDEIKNAMFDIGDDKAPGLDGFTSAFFQKGKILTNRIIGGIKEVVSENQSAFVPSRRISDNILITQELMHSYPRNRGPTRCAFKVDIQKAYDMVDWNLLRKILKCFGFHPIMIKWIMACVTSTSFSLSINGDIHGYFKGKRGLRQEDPLSPYLFTLVMEVLTLILKRKVSLSESFRYHKHCEELQLINVFFADDLLIFARGDMDYARLIMEALDEFKFTSGLVLKGELPVKYLGVPLISSRLLNRDCKVLIEQVKNRIGDWKNKSLSFARRLQLWFLWCNGEYKCGKAKVAWSDICLRKSEGGLGLRSLEIFNMALMTTHIWNIVSNKESLWVRWIHTYKLRGRSFWDIPMKNDVSWGWLKLLQLCDLVWPFFWVSLRNGRSTSIWFDNWCSYCPLIRFLSCLFPIPNLDANKLNAPRWRNHDGSFSEFSVRNVWEVIRPRGDKVGWFRIIWFPHCVPRQAFHLCLAMRKKTQDKPRPWDVGLDVDLNRIRYSFCDLEPDSHDHFFFECSFSSQVWTYVRHLADMDLIHHIFQYIVAHLQPMSNKRMVKSILGRLIFAASSYFIWIEHNNNLFKKIRRPPEEIRDLIMVTVHLKLMSFRFKNKDNVSRLLARWKMPRNFRLYGN
ncbi:hypothetical protein Tco_1343226 [Tanacetum coccineum]